jgi:hypothetical protein
MMVNLSNKLFTFINRAYTYVFTMSSIITEIQDCFFSSDDADVSGAQADGKCQAIALSNGDRIQLISHTSDSYSQSVLEQLSFSTFSIRAARNVGFLRKRCSVFQVIHLSRFTGKNRDKYVSIYLFISGLFNDFLVGN